MPQHFFAFACINPQLNSLFKQATFIHNTSFINVQSFFHCFKSSNIPWDSSILSISYLMHNTTLILYFRKVTATVSLISVGPSTQIINTSFTQRGFRSFITDTNCQYFFLSMINAQNDVNYKLTDNTIARDRILQDILAVRNHDYSNMETTISEQEPPWLACLQLIRNWANVKPRATLRGISRLYICEISYILHNCQLVS